MLLVINHCVSPDFRSVEALEQSGCSTPEALVERVLKAGEIAQLAQSICNLSGFGENVRTLANEVKTDGGGRRRDILCHVRPSISSIGVPKNLSCCRCGKKPQWWP